MLARPLAVAGTWAVFGLSVLSTVTNALARSQPERYIGTPAALALAVTSMIVALG
ncbi:hypothetical protein [Actinomadura sp. 21ATH]|uniref:hypothetical protein n=1 Tax=Actinomadura sp. 21ATH TaxID=1735444 RepID=UPI0035C1A9A1